MNRSLTRALIIFFVSTMNCHVLVAQVLFSRSGGSASTSQADTAATLSRSIKRTGRPAEFRAVYFDSVVHQPAVEPVNCQNPYSRIDSLLAQAADSLFGAVEKRGGSGLISLSSRATEWLPFVPAIPPLRFATWQDYQVSSRFGWRIHPIEGDARRHNGLDLPQPTGTPVFATADGVVTGASWQPDGLGLSVCIQHPTGYQTIYGHLATHFVQLGDKVRRGALIGRVGSTGRSTGPHLHYTILYRGRPVDPARYCFLWVKLARTGWVGSAGPATLPARRLNSAK